jgi:hypothetical protein
MIGAEANRFKVSCDLPIRLPPQFAAGGGVGHPIINDLFHRSELSVKLP